MAAAHSRFRRLPGAMRVLAVELCHYVDILISCAAAVPPAAAPATPTAVATARPAVAGVFSSTEPAEGGSRLGAAANQEVDATELELIEPQGSGAEVIDSVQQDSPEDSPQPSDLAPADQHAAQKSAAEDSVAQGSGQDQAPRGDQASSARQEHPRPQAPPAVRDLYEPLVEFVLELLSDADAGAKPAEIAAPLQLHLRALQIAQWQSSSSTTLQQSAQAESTSAPSSHGQLDLAAHAVQRLLRSGTSLTSLRYDLQRAKMSASIYSNTAADRC